MPVNSIDTQIELYRHKKYRRKRVQFYGLLAIATVLMSVVIGIIIISIQPIDVTNIEDYDTALAVARDEYGESYISQLENMPTIGYESYYESLRTTYVDLMKDDGNVKDKNKIAVDMVAFVEYVQNDAVTTSKGYSLTGKSADFTKTHNQYIEDKGEVFPILVDLVKMNSQEGVRLTDTSVQDHIDDLDKRMSLYVQYLTNLKNA